MSKQKNIKVIFRISGCKMKRSKLGCKKRPGDPYKARCRVCAEDISVRLHGITALFSHADGIKHKEGLLKVTPISFFERAEPSSSASTILSNDVRDSNEVSS